MVRAALAPSKSRKAKGAKPFASIVPAASVILASLLTALPIVSLSGWYPDFAYIVFLGWRLLRDDPWPGWWAGPLGLIQDILAGSPIGYSVALWCVTMIALDILDRRTMWRDYWIEWLLAALFLAANEWLQWRIAAASDAAPDVTMLLPKVVIAILAFPIGAWIVGRLDSWRLGR